jgi:hypothetical protein
VFVACARVLFGYVIVFHTSSNSSMVYNCKYVTVTGHLHDTEIILISFQRRFQLWEKPEVSGSQICL